jgi:hypothetical protein
MIFSLCPGSPLKNSVHKLKDLSLKMKNIFHTYSTTFNKKTLLKLTTQPTSKE